MMMADTKQKQLSRKLIAGRVSGLFFKYRRFPLTFLLCIKDAVLCNVTCVMITDKYGHHIKISRYTILIFK